MTKTKTVFFAILSYMESFCILWCMISLSDQIKSPRSNHPEMAGKLRLSESYHFRLLSLVIFSNASSSVNFGSGFLLYRRKLTPNFGQNLLKTQLIHQLCASPLEKDLIRQAIGLVLYCFQHISFTTSSTCWTLLTINF